MEPEPGTASRDVLTYDIESFLTNFDRAHDWMLSSSGIRSGAGRFTEYRRVLERKYTRSANRSQDIHEVSTAIAESLELVLIWRSLNELSIPHLGEKLSKYASGPFYEKDERTTSASNLSRNTGFELSVFARLVQTGLRATLTTSADILLEEDGAQVVFECKRPQSKASVAKNIQAGVRQLRTRREREFLGLKFIGVLVLSIGKVVHHGEQLMQVHDFDGFNQLSDEALNRFGQEYESNWSAKRHAKYCHLCLVMLSTPALDEGGEA